MNFKNNDPIYLQIAEYVKEKIVLQQWAIGEKIPSVRDLAVELQVNPNTVMRSYEFLQSSGVVYNKRGIGFFVSDEATLRIKNDKKKKFLEEELPVLFKSMSMLGLTMDELQEEFERFMKKR